MQVLTKQENKIYKMAHAKLRQKCHVEGCDKEAKSIYTQDKFTDAVDGALIKGMKIIIPLCHGHASWLRHSDTWKSSVEDL